MNILRFLDKRRYSQNFTVLKNVVHFQQISQRFGGLLKLFKTAGNIKENI